MKKGTNTKYSTYTQSQRLDMIKNGNTDVYEAEKDNNAYLKSLRKSLGLSTEDIDAWDKTIDNAAKVTAEDNTKAVLPKFQSSRVGKISGMYNDYMRALTNDNLAKQKQAREQAKKDINYLVEYLVNNGYAADGKTASEGKKRIREQLRSLLEELRYEYKKAHIEARDKYIAMLDKSRKQ